MDPKAKADHFKDFIKQVGKYLVVVEKERQAKWESQIKEKLAKIRENKDLMMEYHDQDIENLLNVKSKGDANNNLNFSNWIKSYFTPEYLKTNEVFIRSKTPSLRKSMTNRNCKSF